MNGTNKRSLRLHGELFLRRLPGWVAFDEGLFESEGLDVSWVELDPLRAQPESRDVQYRIKETSLRRGEVDIFKVCQWGGILRSAESAGAARIFAVDAGAKTGLYGIFSHHDSPIRGVLDLADAPIGISEHTGSFYRVLEALEPHLDPQQIRTVHAGPPFRRLRALLSRQLVAAELMDFLVPLAEALGLRRIPIKTQTRPGVFMARSGVSSQDLQAFSLGWNRAVNRINQRSEHYLEEASRRFLDSLPKSFNVALPDFKAHLGSPIFSHLQPFAKEQFDETYKWMRERDLIASGHHYQDLVLGW